MILINEFKTRLWYLVLIFPIQLEGEIVSSNYSKTQIDSIYFVADSIMNYANDSLELNMSLGLFQKTLEIYEQLNDSLMMGNAIRKIGNIYKDYSKFDKALAQYDFALEIAIEIQNHKLESAVYNSIGNVHESLGNYIKALDVFEKSLDIKDQFGFEESKGKVYNNIGLVYLDMSEYSKALEYFENSLSFKMEYDSPNSLGKTLNNIGLVYLDLGEYKKALGYFEQDLKICRDIGNKIGEGISLNNIGLVYESLSEYPKALNYFKKDLEISREVGDRESEAISLNNIGLVYESLSNFPKALEYYYQDLKISREIGNRQSEATSLNNIGLVYEAQSNHQKALEYFNNSLLISREIMNPLNESLALNNIGLIYESISDYQTAINYFQESLDIALRLGNRLEQSLGWNNIGLIYYARGDYDKALDYFDKALKLSREIEDKKGTALVLNNIGLIYAIQNNFEQALIQFELTLKISREIGNKMEEALALNNIGNLQIKLKNYKVAEKNLLKSLDISNDLGLKEELKNTYFVLGNCYHEQGFDSLAVENYKMSIDIIEDIRGELAVESHKTSYMTGVVEIYKKLINILIHLERKVEALNYLERMKARVLLDILNDGKINFTDIMTQSELQQENSILAKLEKLNELISHLNSDDQLKLDSLKILREDKRAELLSFESNLYLTHPDLKINRGKAKPINFNKAQRMLNRNEAAIYFLPTEDKLISFVLSRDNLEVFTQQIRQDSLNSLIDRFTESMNFNSIKWDKYLSHTLYELLVAPFELSIRGKELICIIPEGKLNYIPFQALINTKGEYFIENFAVYYTPSLSSLSWLRTIGTYGTSDLLAYGNCNFEEKEDITALRSILMPLPASEKEVNSIAKFYNSSSSVFTKSNATESSFKQLAAEFGVIHLATHAITNEDNPMYSSIAFSMEESEDGFLEAREIIKMELNADLVVLSACNTAFSKQLTGEGMLGLTRAFFTAGVSTIISSLWDVEDYATQLLMVEFHKKLKKGHRPARALQKAQIRLIQNQKYSNPIYWAPFVLIGDSE